jgi:hypothetical protein
MITRDSALLPLAVAGSVLGYLILVGTPPTAWNYVEWLKALAFAVATASAQLGTSPLRGDGRK